MKVGYARVSSKDQNLDRQIAALRKGELPHANRTYKQDVEKLERAYM